jgi:hypothetical protein
MSKIQISTRKIAVDNANEEEEEEEEESSSCSRGRSTATTKIGQESFQGPSSFLPLATSSWPLA